MAECIVGGAGVIVTPLIQTIAFPEGTAHNQVLETLHGRLLACEISSGGSSSGIVIVPQSGESIKILLGSWSSNTYYAKVTFAENSATISLDSENPNWPTGGGVTNQNYTAKVRGLIT